MPDKHLKNTVDNSEIAHKNRELIFITKNGYIDPEVVSREYYESFSDSDRIDKAIYESDKEYARTGHAVEAHEFFDNWEKKHERNL